MTRTEIPQSSRTLIQGNNGSVISDLTGNIKSTYGIDTVTNPGKIRGNKRMYVNTDQSSVAGLQGGVAQIFEFTSPFSGDSFANVYAAIGDNGGNDEVLYHQSTDGLDPTASFDADMRFNNQDVRAELDDATVFNGDVIVSSGDDLNKIGQGEGASPQTDAGWWTGTLSQSALKDHVDGDTTRENVTHPLGVTVAGSEYLLIADNHNKVYTVDSSSNVVTSPGSGPALTLRPDMQIMKFLTTSTRVYILCRNINGYRGLIYEWVLGKTDTNGNQIPNRVYTLPCEGAMSGVVVDDVPYVLTSDGALRVLTSRGFTVTTALPTYYKNKELINARGSFTNIRFVHPNGMDIEQGKIYMLLDTRLSDGGYDADTPSGIWMFDPNRESLEHHASLGISDGTDYGQAAISRAGALLATGKANARFLAGGMHFTGSATVTYSQTVEEDESSNSEDTGAIYVSDEADSFDHVSRITFPQAETANVKDDWNAFALHLSKMSRDFDKIVVKYRTEEVDSVSGSVTWSNASEFSITADLSNFEENDEVFIIQGQGAGISAHISTIRNPSGNDYKITLDEAIGPASGSSRVVVDNFKKYTALGKDSEQGQIMTLPTKPDIWAQIRLELRGSGDRPEISRMIINSKTNQDI